jgi:thiol:disulfide interchange protein DsbD
MIFRIAVLLVAGLAVDKPIAWDFAKPALEGKPAPGAVVKVKLKASIAEGWHMYSLKRMDGGPIATRITVPEGQPFALAGAIEASEPIKLQDPVFEMEVEYWTEAAAFTLPVRIAAAARPGPATLKVATRYQTCDDKLCLPPRTETLELKVEIKEAKNER